MSYTWTQSNAPNANWTGIASDSTGQYVVAVASTSSGASSGRIYSSTDFGSTWSPTSAPNPVFWTGIASDSTGQYLVAVAAYVGIYTLSPSSSPTWVLTTAPTNVSWDGIASDSSGANLAAVVNGGGIYTLSPSSSPTWVLQTSAPTNVSWSGIASSSSGQNLVGVVYGGGIYASNDYGSTWSLTSAPILNWGEIASDSSGQHLNAVVFGGGIYRGTYTPNTNYIVNGLGDISTLFLPLSGGTSTTATGYFYNAGTLLAPNYQDLNTLFAAYFAPPYAPPTNFFSSAHGGNDLNLVFQNIEPPISYIVNSSSNIIITQYKNINGYNAVTFECLYPTTTVGLASITSFVALNNVIIIIVGGGGGGAYNSSQGGGGGGLLTCSLTSTIPSNSTFNIQVGNGGVGGVFQSGNLPVFNGANGQNSTLDIDSPSPILQLAATGGQGGLSWYNASSPAPPKPSPFTHGSGGIGELFFTTLTIAALTLAGGGGGSGGSYLSTNSSSIYGGNGGTPPSIPPLPSVQPTVSMLINGANGADCSGTALNASHSGPGGNSGLTSVAVPFSTNPSTITLGGGGGGSSNQNGSGSYGSWCGAAGKGTGGAGSTKSGYSGFTPYTYVVAGSGTSSLPTGGYGGGGGAGCQATTQASYGGNGGGGCVILYWPA